MTHYPNNYLSISNDSGYNGRGLFAGNRLGHTVLCALNSILYPASFNKDDVAACSFAYPSHLTHNLISSTPLFACAAPHESLIRYAARRKRENNQCQSYF